MSEREIIALMTITELGEMTPKEARRWVRTTATKEALQDTLGEVFSQEIEDYSPSELRQALFDAWMDGDIGMKLWNRVKLQRAILELVDDART